MTSPDLLAALQRSLDSAREAREARRPGVVKLPPRTPCPVCAGGGHAVITPRGEAHPAQPRQETRP